MIAKPYHRLSAVMLFTTVIVLSTASHAAAYCKHLTTYSNAVNDIPGYLHLPYQIDSSARKYRPYIRHAVKAWNSIDGATVRIQPPGAGPAMKIVDRELPPRWGAFVADYLPSTNTIRVNATVTYGPNGRWEGGRNDDMTPAGLRSTLSHEFGHALGIEDHGYRHNIGYDYLDLPVNPCIAYGNAILMYWQQVGGIMTQRPRTHDKDDYYDRWGKARANALPPSVRPSIDTISSSAPGTVEIRGTNLGSNVPGTGANIQLFTDRGVPRYYNPQQGGINFPGTIVSWSSNSILIFDALLYDNVIGHLAIYDHTNSLMMEQDVGLYVRPPIQTSSISSISALQLRITGSALQFAALIRVTTGDGRVLEFTDDGERVVQWADGEIVLQDTSWSRLSIVRIEIMGSSDTLLVDEPISGLTIKPPPPPDIRAIRGASGVAAVWEQVDFADSFDWYCSSTPGETTGGTVTTIPGIGDYHTPVCPSQDGSVVTVTVRANGPAGYSDDSSSAERPDLRPSVASSPTSRRTDSLVGVQPIVVSVAETDGVEDLLQPSSRETRLPNVSGAADSGDQARVVVTVRDPNGSTSGPDASVRVIWQFAPVVGGMRVMLDEGLTLAEPLVDALAPALTCTPGVGVVQSANWRLDCSALGADVGVAADGVRLMIPLEPLVWAPDQVYEIEAHARDRRQPADNQFLTAVSGGPDAPVSAANRTDLGVLVVDRHRPVVDSSGAVGSSGPRGRIVASMVVHDVVPGSAEAGGEDPLSLDASGVADASYVIERRDSVAGVWEPDTGLTSLACSPWMPRGASDSLLGGESVLCESTVSPVQAGALLYRVTYRATDVVGNDVSASHVVTGRVEAPGVDVVRGAGGVVGVWQGVLNDSYFEWECSSAGGVIDSGTIPAASAVSTPGLDGVVTYHTPLCAAVPGVEVTVRVTAHSMLYDSVVAVASQTVDERPTLAIGDGRSSANNLYFSTNGAVPNPDVVVDVGDADGNLFAGSAPDARLADLGERPSPDIASGDRARLVVTGVDGNGSAPAPDGSFRLVVEFGETAADTRVMLQESGAEFDEFRDELVAGATCRVGAGEVVGASWRLDCAASDVVYSGGGARVTLALRPLEATHDQVYAVSGAVRDQRQGADNRYLTAVSGGLDASIGGAGVVELRDVVPDRLLPRFDHSEARGTPTPSGVIVMEAGAHDVTPSGLTLPVLVEATGVKDATFRVDWSDVNDLAGPWSEDTGMMSFGDGCVPGVPRRDPGDVPLRSGVVECGQVRAPQQACKRLYKVTYGFADLAGNHEERSHAVTGCIDPPEVEAIRGAGGVAGVWRGVPNDSYYVWRCSGPEGLIASGTIRAFSSAATPGDDESHVYHTPLCDARPSTPGADPGESVTISVAGSSMLYTSSPGTATNTVDRRASVTRSGDEDGASEPRYDSLNGQVHLGDGYFPDGEVYANGTRNRDVVIEATDPDGADDIRSASTPDTRLDGLVDTEGEPVRPVPDVGAGDHARVVVTLRDEQAADPAVGVYAIVQMAAHDADIMIALDETPTQGDPFTRVLTEGESCHPGTGTTSTEHWVLDCTKVVVDDVPGGVRLRLPIWPEAGYSTPDQSYPVTGHVRDRRQAADNRYLSAITGEPSPDTQIDADNDAALGRVVLDRVTPRFNTANTIGLATTEPGSIRLDANASDPPRTVPPGLYATGVKEVTYRLEYDDGSGAWLPDGDVDADGTPDLVDLGCVERSDQLPTTCSDTIGVVHAQQDRYRITMQVVDQAGNHDEVVRTLSGRITDRPEVDAVRGAGGVAAAWSEVSGAVRYGWECSVSGSPIDGGIVSAGEALRTPLCSAAPGSSVTIKVVAYSDLYASVAGEGAESVDRRPEITAGADPDGTGPFYDSLGGTIYANGMRDRDFWVRISDPDSPRWGLREASSPDERFDASPSPGAGDHARTLVTIDASVNQNPVSSVRAIVQLGATGSDTRVLLDEYPYLGAPFTIDIGESSLVGLSCSPGDPTTITGSYWRLDCSQIQIDGSNPIDITLPIHPILTTPDEHYDVTAHLRDQRQPADNAYLTAIAGPVNGGNGPTNLLDLGELYLDRHTPTGTITGTPATGGAIDLSAILHDVEPGSDPSDPQFFTATGIATISNLQVDYETTPGTWTSDGPALQITCTPTSTTDHTTITCTRSVTPVHTATRYRFTLTATDHAGNHADVSGVVTVVAAQPGTLDTSFGAGGVAREQTGTLSSTSGQDAIIDHNGLLVLAASQPSFPSPRAVVIRHTANGHVDTSFGVNGAAIFPVVDGSNTTLLVSVRGVIERPDNSLVVVGAATINVGGVASERAWYGHLTPSGTIDTTFGGTGVVVLPQLNAQLNEVALDDQGRTVATGGITSSGTRRMTVIRMQEDGTLDATFGSAGMAVVNPPSALNSVGFDVDVQPDGKLVVTGSGSFLGFGDDMVVARFNSNGTLDTSFDSDGMQRATIALSNLADSLLAGTIQPNGSIVSVGYTFSSSTTSVFAAIRLTASGTFDTTFDTDGKVTTPVGASEPGAVPGSFERAVDVRANTDGTILVAGSSMISTSSSRVTLVRYQSNGQLDTTWGTNGITATALPNSTNAIAAALLARADGRIIVAGTGDFTGGGQRAFLAGFYE